MKVFIAIACLILFPVQSILAQEPSSTKKQELVKELLVVTDSSNTATKIIESILTEMRKQYPRMIESLADADPDLTPAQRQKIKTSSSESYVRFSKTLQERLTQRIDLGKVVSEISYSLYDKYFTEGEVADLISFYKTSTGKKTLSVLPQMYAESIQKTGEKLSPALTELIMEIVTEEKERLKRTQ